uniref:Uncharacterized protein n=1 Tax=Setaria italica TaxID=4555 RepID=K3YXD5_SETIT
MGLGYQSDACAACIDLHLRYANTLLASCRIDHLASCCGSWSKQSVLAGAAPSRFTSTSSSVDATQHAHLMR